VQNTNVLLSVRNLKKYFPIKGSGLLGRGARAVHANENITLDIYEGETLGLVGESGSGKSTLGRTLLQLYEQTAGDTLYYGRTLAEIDPRYVGQTLGHAREVLDAVRKRERRAKILAARCRALGESATPRLRQRAELARSEADTAFGRAVRLLGGFAALDDPREGAALLLRRHEAEVRAARLRARLTRSTCDTSGETHGEQIKRLQNELDILECEVETYAKKLDVLKKRYADTPKFAEYEQLLDTGIDLSRLHSSEMRLLRRDLQIIFQDPFASLDPRMTIGESILEGMQALGIGSSENERKAKMAALLERVGLPREAIGRLPHEFSGGQRQRVAIARALAVDPKLIVCDEPTSALDVSVQAQILNLMKTLQRELGIGYLFITHNFAVVEYMADTVAVMQKGRIVEYGRARDVLDSPRHPYTQRLLAAVPSIMKSRLE
jgi:peptide/nickel transport system ATP-binding protein